MIILIQLLYTLYTLRKVNVNELMETIWYIMLNVKRWMRLAHNSMFSTVRVRFSVKHIYSTKRENIDQQGYALYKDLCNETYIQ